MDRIQLVKQINNFLKINYKNKDYFCCLYGSSAYQNDILGDIDIFIAIIDYGADEYERFKKFIIDLHVKNNLEIDNEVPFENKLMVTYLDLEKSFFGAGFKLQGGFFVVPPIKKDKKFLSSDQMRWRLLFNALTSPHIFISGNRQQYLVFKRLAEQNIILLASDLVQSKIFSNDDLLNVLLSGPRKEEGELYLGYKKLEIIKNYLKHIIENQYKLLQKKGIFAQEKDKIRMIDDFVLIEMKSVRKEILSEMTDKKRIFIGVAWPYVNGEIHIGHLAGYLLPADILARFSRLKDYDVLMVSGSDCFGTPILFEAVRQKLKPSDLSNRYHKKLKDLLKSLNISFDIYTKTNNSIHKTVVQDVFCVLHKKGYIFKERAKQYYSKNEKRFLPDRFVEGICKYCNFDGARGDQCDACGKVLEPGELINPKDRDTNSPVILKESEHYFMAWPKLLPFLKQYLAIKEHLWKRWVTNETRGWLKIGLASRAITRDIVWGVKIPTQKLSHKDRIKSHYHKSIYVWFDAVIGYLSASIQYSLAKKQKDLWKRFWYNNRAKHYYFMGKDNLLFHALFWPGQIFAYNNFLHLPDVVSVNQFLNLDGNKFSKSRGVIINCGDLVNQYGINEVRFYLCYIMPENRDANFSYPDFFDKINMILVADIGNFIHRNLTLAQKNNFKPSLPVKINKDIIERARNAYSSAEKNIFNCQFKNYLDEIINLARYSNQYTHKQEPWSVKEMEKFNSIMTELFYLIITIGVLLNPLLPEASLKLQKMLNLSRLKYIRDFDELHQYIISNISNIKITSPSPLFKKIITQE